MRKIVLDNLLNTTLNELLSIVDIGEIRANSILEFVNLNSASIFVWIFSIFKSTP